MCAIIERAGDGTSGVYMDADGIGCPVTDTGGAVEEAKRMSIGGYEDTKREVQFV